MIKEDYYNDLDIFHISHPFAEKRYNASFGGVYFHAGIDYTSLKYKRQDIYNNIAGVISDFGTGRDYGNYVLIRHNASISYDSPDENFYSLYCHLSEIDQNVNNAFSRHDKFINSGTVIGKMGNTGYCMTKGITGKWRRLTKKEVTDIDCKKGVHLHYQTHQIAAKNEDTKLLKELLKLGIVEKGNTNHYFWQWGKLIYNPICIMNYLKFLQGRKNYSQK